MGQAVWHHLAYEARDTPSWHQRSSGNQTDWPAADSTCSIGWKAANNSLLVPTLWDTPQKLGPQTLTDDPKLADGRLVCQGPKSALQTPRFMTLWPLSTTFTSPDVSYFFCMLSNGSEPLHEHTFREVWSAMAHWKMPCVYSLAVSRCLF